MQQVPSSRAALLSMSMTSANFAFLCALSAGTSMTESLSWIGDCCCCCLGEVRFRGFVFALLLGMFSALLFLLLFLFKYFSDDSSVKSIKSIGSDMVFDMILVYVLIYNMCSRARICREIRVLL